MINIEDSFNTFNIVHDITKEDYQKADSLVIATKAFARSIYQCVYIIDFFKRDFLYISDNIVCLCGETSSQIKKAGCNFYLNHIPEEDLRMLLEVNHKGFEFITEKPYNERLNYTISYDFHLKYGKKSKLLNHHLTPLALTKDGHIWLALCTISMSAWKSSGYITLKNLDIGASYQYSLETHRWIKKDIIVLSETERDIIGLSSQGYTMNDIADKLCKSIDTIKACKKALFSSMGVNNISEAILYATNNKLL